MAQHHHTVSRQLFFALEPATQLRRYSYRLKKARRNLHAGNPSCLTVAVGPQHHAPRRVGRHRSKALALRPPIEEVRIRRIHSHRRRPTGSPRPSQRVERDQSRRLRKRQRPQQYGVHQTEHHSGRRNPQRNRKYHGYREPRRPAKLPQSITKILNQSQHENPPRRTSTSQAILQPKAFNRVTLCLPMIASQASEYSSRLRVHFRTWSSMNEQSLILLN